MFLQKYRAAYAASEQQYTAVDGDVQVPRAVFTSDGLRNKEFDTDW